LRVEHGGRRGAGQAASKAGTGRVQQIAYVPGAMRRPVSTSQTAWDIEQQVAANVGAIATRRSARAGRARSATILYSGDPRDYIDCGRSACGLPGTPKSMKGRGQVELAPPPANRTGVGRKLRRQSHDHRQRAAAAAPG
jgi:hypothetical protein